MSTDNGTESIDHFFVPLPKIKISWVKQRNGWMEVEPQLFFFFFNWKIIFLQYCVGFCFTTRISSEYMYIPSLLWLSLTPTPGPLLHTERHLKNMTWSLYFIVGVQPLSHIQLFVTPWTAGHRAPLSSDTVSQSLLKVMAIESVLWALLSSANSFSNLS